MAAKGARPPCSPASDVPEPTRTLPVNARPMPTGRSAPSHSLTPALQGPIAGPDHPQAPGGGLRLVPFGAAEVTPDLLRRLVEAEQAADGAYAANGNRARAADTRRWAAWCAARGVCPLPATPADVALYLRAHAATHRPATIARWAVTIAFRHRQVGLADPTKAEPVRLALRAIRRGEAASARTDDAWADDVPAGRSAAGTEGPGQSSRPSAREQRQALGLRAPALRRIETALERRAAGGPLALGDQRDLALLLVARDLLARRSELVALRVEDVTEAESGDGSGTALILRSKTDQAGEGAEGFLAPETMVALRTWCRAAGITRGPLFRAVSRHGRVATRALGAKEVARRFKRLGALAGLDAARVSGHSARVGMAQDLVGAGLGLPEVMQAGRWSSAAMVARYTRAQAAQHGAVARFHRQAARGRA